MSQQTANIPTARALAAMCDRHPSQITRWMKHPLWKFGGPPWPRTVAPEILRWIAGVLDDRNWRERKPSPPEAEVEMPGALKFTADSIVTGDTPLTAPIRPAVGETLFSELTIADFESLSRHLNFGTCSLLMSANEVETGKAELLGSAPAAYYQSLAEKVPEDRLAAAWNNTLVFWMACRFIDRPGWAEVMPAAPSPELVAEAIADAEPLKHRTPAKASKAPGRRNGSSPALARTGAK